MISNFTAKNGEKVEIHIDEDEYKVSVTTTAGQQVGELSFRYIEDEAAPGGGYLKLIHAFLEDMGKNYIGQNIGTECVKLMAQATDLSICVSPDDGIEREDGSRLTGSGAAFAAKLKRERLIFEC